MTRRALAALVVAGGLLHAGPALAFKRTTTAGGIPLFWSNPQVTMVLNEGAATPSCTSSAAPSVAAVQAVIPTWGAATSAGSTTPCSKASLSYGGTTASGETGYFQGEPGAPANSNLIVWRTKLCSQVVPAGDACTAACPVGLYCQNCPSKYHCWDDTRNSKTIALTTVTYASSTGQIFDADMELYGWDGTAGPLNSSTNVLGNLDGWYFTCVDSPAGPGAAPATCSAADQNPPAVCTCATYGQSNCIFMDVQNTVTHELGHVLGLDHSNVASATMSATASPGETGKRTLDQDDMDGICSAYPAPKSSSGCATAGSQPTLFALLLGILALRLGVRRRTRRVTVSSTRSGGPL